MLVLSQTAGAGDITEVAKLVTQIGLSAIFLWLWWTERKERIEQGAQILALLKEVLPALAQSSDVLKDVQDALGGLVEKGTPDHRALDLSYRRMELMLDDLAKTMRQQRRRREDFDDGT